MKTRTGLAGTLLAAALATAMAPVGARAADHREAPGSAGDPAADLADVYAWHDAASNRLTVVLTYDGLAAPVPGSAGTFDADVLYAVNIDNTGDFVADRIVSVRFAEAPRGRLGMDKKGRSAERWVMIIDNLPGSNPSVTVPVERSVNLPGGLRAFAGLRDDPFFFDLQGFQTTLQTGTLAFDATRDSFAGMNASAIVLEMNLATALDGGSALNLWATTARK